MLEPTDTEVRGSLRLAARPRPPRAEFAAHLREELISSGEGLGVPDLEPAGSATIPHHSATRRRLLGAAAVIAVAGAAAGIAIARHDVTLATPPAATSQPAKPLPDRDAARRACATFHATAFSPRQRFEVVGTASSMALTTDADVIDAAERLRAATDTLRTSLISAGAATEDVLRALDRIERRTVQAVASARVHRDLTDARRHLVAVDDRLIELETVLAAGGFDGCH